MVAVLDVTLSTMLYSYHQKKKKKKKPPVFYIYIYHLNVGTIKGGMATTSTILASR